MFVLAPVDLTQPTLLVTLASFSMNISPFLTSYRLCLNPATHISTNFAAFDHILTTKLPVPLSPPSYTPSLITATQFNTTYLILSLTVFNTSKILWLVLSSGPQSLPKSTLL